MLNAFMSSEKMAPPGPFGEWGCLCSVAGLCSASLPPGYGPVLKAAALNPELYWDFTTSSLYPRALTNVLLFVKGCHIVVCLGMSAWGPLISPFLLSSPSPKYIHRKNNSTIHMETKKTTYSQINPMS